MTDILNEAKSGVAKLHELQMSLDTVQKELQSNPKFIEFLKLQDELKAKREKFDASMKELMIERYQETGEKKLEVGNATFSLTPREELVIEDVDKIDPLYVRPEVTYKLNKEAVKAAQVLEGKLVDGVGIKRSYAYKLVVKDSE